MGGGIGVGIGWGVSLNELEQGVPLKMLKMLSHLLQPLSSGDKIPPRQDLSDYWERTERALNGLSN